MQEMFCYQCQEAIDNKGCTKIGVCGKTPEVASKLDVIKYICKALAKETINQELNRNQLAEIDKYIMNALFTCITNANFDPDNLKEVIDTGIELFAKYSSSSYDFEGDKIKGNPLGTDNEDIRSARETILNGLMGAAAYHAHAANLGKTSDDVYEFTRKALNSLLDDSLELNDYVALIDETGKCGVEVMALLDGAHTSTYGTPEISKVNLGVCKNPGILISGHDLHDIKELLEQSKGSGVDIYTHSEMIPAHYYPELKKYENLVGNYGGAWHTQREEFETFNGPIIFTTNCLVPPSKNATYNDRVYVTGNTGMPNWKQVKVNAEGTKDFSEVIEHARKCQPPTEIESGEIIGGFAHGQVFALADKVIDAIKSGAIKKFVVMAGCDGRLASRKYYTEFAKALPQDTIILTAGCAKYRYNKLDLGDIGGIPRVLDAGQCNDSYSLALIALKLGEIFNCDINELPIAYNIAWYEQKAVIVLLSLLHLKIQNIHVGPTIPAFLSENVATFLINTFNLGTISTVEEDIQKMILT